MDEALKHIKDTKPLETTQTWIDYLSGISAVFVVYKYTGWLKLKYPTGQNAISRQPCEIFIPKFHGLYESDPATILHLKNNFLSGVMAVEIFYAIFSILHGIINNDL